MAAKSPKTSSRVEQCSALLRDRRPRLHTVFGKDANILKLPKKIKETWLKEYPLVLHGWPSAMIYPDGSSMEEHHKLQKAVEVSLPFVNTLLPFILYFETRHVTHTVTIQSHDDIVACVIPLDDEIVTTGCITTQFCKRIVWNFDWKLEETESSGITMKTFGRHTVPTRTKTSGKTVLYVDLDTKSTQVTYLDAEADCAICRFSYEPPSVHNAGIHVHIQPLRTISRPDEVDAYSMLWSSIPEWLLGGMTEERRKHSQQELMDVLAARSLDIRDSIIFEDPTLDRIILPTLPTIRCHTMHHATDYKFESSVWFYPDGFVKCLEQLVSQAQNWIVCQCLDEEQGADAAHDKMKSILEDMVLSVEKLVPEIGCHTDPSLITEEDRVFLCKQFHDMAISAAAVEVCKEFKLDELGRRQSDFWHACEHPPCWLKHELWLWTRDLFIYGARLVLAQILATGCETESAEISKLEENKDHFEQCLKKLGLSKNAVDPGVTGASRLSLEEAEKRITANSRVWLKYF